MFVKVSAKHLTCGSIAAEEDVLVANPGFAQRWTAIEVEVALKVDGLLCGASPPLTDTVETNVPLSVKIPAEKFVGVEIRRLKDLSGEKGEEIQTEITTENGFVAVKLLHPSYVEEGYIYVDAFYEGENGHDRIIAVWKLSVLVNP